MAENIKYCRSCGAQMSANAKFCKACGAEAVVSLQPSSATIQPILEKRTCPQCGNEVSDTAKFCKKCGYKFEGAPIQTLANTPPRSASPVQQPPVSGIGDAVTASAQPGEFSFMDFVTETVTDAASSSETVKGVMAPFTAIGSSIKSYLGGIIGIFKSPKTIIMAVVMAALWTFLGINRGSDSTPLKALSWLTFADGGFDRGAFGVLGGIAGKGVVGVLLVSLFTGGIPKLASGFGSLFGKTKSKRSIVFMLVGLIIGICLYILFTGENASGATAMAGISGALLAVMALGSKDGNIYQISEAITSQKVDGVRVAQDGKANSLLGGMTLGFAIITALLSLV